jgi:protein involved in polysaccharide export with SLBB domain
MTFSSRGVRRFFGMVGLAAATWFLAGCVSGPTPIKTPPDRSVDKIVLQTGDGIEVDLTGTPTTIAPTITTLNGAGTISLPSITNIVAVGKTPHQVEDEINAAYVPRIYPHISVTVTPGNRYYTVSGQISQPGLGKQLYTGHVTLLGAIGAAGGFTDFAARKRVQLTGQDGKIYIIDCKKALKDPKLDIEVLPGDKIFVDQKTPGEAFFGK